MTKVVYKLEEGIHSIKIDGHAGYNPGMDIVCGSASVLGFTLINMLEDKEAEIKHIKLEDGSIHIEIKPVIHNQSEIKTIIDTILMGYSLVEEEYPNNLVLEC